MACLRWRRGVERLGELAKVEMQGKISLGRVVAIARYTDRASTFRKAAVLLLSPAPSLVVTLLGELIPLAPPDVKHRSHWGYRARLWYTMFVFTYINIHQFSHYLQTLSAPELQLFVRALAVTTLTVACDYAVIDMFAFPVPFSLVTLSSIWVTAVLADMALFWGKAVYERFGEMKQVVINTFKIWVCQFTLIGIYPIYYFVYGLLGTPERVILMFLLPVMKLILRIWFGNSVTHLRDELPEVVVTNVDVFNALFMMYCMQITPSLMTTLGLMILDFTQSAVSLHDIRSILSSVNKLNEHINKAKGPLLLSRSCSYTPRAAAIISPAYKPATAPLVKGIPRLRHTFHQMEPQRALQGEKISPVSSQPAANSAILPHSVVLVNVKMIGDGSRVQSTLRSTVNLAESRFVLGVRQLLYVAEFLLLLNYVEFAIPVVYGKLVTVLPPCKHDILHRPCIRHLNMLVVATYLAVLYHLPTCIYFPQIASMTVEHLNSTLVNLYLYAGLEMLSLLLLHIILSRMFHLPGLAQLAFTLESQWIGVQSKLVFWVFYNAQTPLQHSGKMHLSMSSLEVSESLDVKNFAGFDYSFKFAWLHASNLTNSP